MVDPIVSEYFRQLVKKRTDNHRGFNNPDVAKLAGQKGRETQRKNKEIKKARENNTI
jgi:hypothetical protein